MPEQSLPNSGILSTRHVTASRTGDHWRALGHYIWGRFDSGITNKKHRNEEHGALSGWQQEHLSLRAGTRRRSPLVWPHLGACGRGLECFQAALHVSVNDQERPVATGWGWGGYRIISMSR